MLHLGINNPKVIYSINNLPIMTVNSVKDLGVFITDDLSWRPHAHGSVIKESI